MDVRKLDAPLGAEICNLDLSRELSGAERRQLLDAYHDHSALLVRGQALTDARLVAVGRIFGEIELAPPNKSGKHWIEGFPELACISNVKVDGHPTGSLGNGEAIWHTDMSFMEEPPNASLLYALEVPGAGGGTHLLNMYTAYETLPDALRECVAGKVAIHDATYTSAGEVRKKFAEFVGNTDPDKAPGARHPLVRVHPATGRKALYLGRRSGASGIIGEKDDTLWRALWDHCLNSALSWAHRWVPGDLLIWDNRCVMHYREAFDDSERRIMHRAQTKGERPVAA